MTKNEFKERWESNENGGGITFDDIAQCAIAWGICKTPRTKSIDLVRYKVLCAANTTDCEDYSPHNLLDD